MRPRARTDELGLAALRERDRDEVEVSWHDRRREELRRLLDDLVPEVPRRHVGECEQLDARLARDQRRFAGRRVSRLAGAVALVREERRLVDEEVGARRRLYDRC